MTSEQVSIAFVVAIVILGIVAIPRILRRRKRLVSGFGAGGHSTVPIGSIGIAKTDLDPSGVVLVVGEQWTADSRAGTRIADGTRVRVVDQDGLTLLVEAAPPVGTPVAE